MKPFIETRHTIVFAVQDDMGVFEVRANEASDIELLQGLVNLIDAAKVAQHETGDPWPPEHAWYAVYWLLCDYFCLDRAKDGVGDRLTRVLFDGEFHR